MTREAINVFGKVSEADIDTIKDSLDLYTKDTIVEELLNTKVRK